MKPETFDWKRFHARRVFDEFIDRFVFNRKSYVTRHEDQLDLEVALAQFSAVEGKLNE